MDFTWIGSSLLAYVSGESIIRYIIRYFLWLIEENFRIKNYFRVLDIEKDENFTLMISSQYGYSNNESIISISYSAAKGIIAAGTDKGNVAMWKFMQNRINSNEPESSWQLMHAKQLQQIPIKRLRVKKFKKSSF